MWLAILLVTVLAAYLFYRRQFTYWQRRGVPHLPNFRIPYGHVADPSCGQLNPVVQPSYEAFKNSASAPFVGVYYFHRPIALVVDPQLVKQVLIKDFDQFQDRGVYNNARGDPLSGHLFAMSGDPWRRMRSKLTPTFTSGKMRFMYPTMLEVAQRFDGCLSDLVAAGDPGVGAELEIKDLLSRFTTDIIGTCAFGIECNSLADPAAEFRRMGRRIFGKPRHGRIGNLLINTFKSLALRLNVKTIPEEVSEFFLSVVEETVRTRLAEGIKRNDFMDQLIEMHKQGALDIGEMAAQVFIFFGAGFETSSNTTMFALYELALNGALQERVRREVAVVLEKHGGELSYEAIMEMQYMDQVINETLRKYPSAGTVVRKASKEYPVSGSNLTIPKGISVLIPVYAIQHDADIYPDPERFDPERFAPAAKADRDLVSFLAFGQGPRNCIGMRFAQMLVRLGLAMVLSNYRVQTTDKTLVPLRFAKAGFGLRIEGGMFLRLTKLEKS